MEYGSNVFHMHVDGKIGIRQPKNRTQRHMSRLLFSLVTPLVNGKGQVEQEFTAPEQPGRYPFLCTFPGHWRVMKGVLIVD